MIGRSGALLLAALAFSPGARAQEDAIFARKNITIYVGNTAGGTYDLYARLVSRHLGRFLPGRPGVVVENMPGAGSLRAANFIHGVAPKDGTAIGIVTENVAIEQALQNPAVQYDASKFTWIGRVGRHGPGRRAGRLGPASTRPRAEAAGSWARPSSTRPRRRRKRPVGRRRWS